MVADADGAAASDVTASTRALPSRRRASAGDEGEGPDETKDRDEGGAANPRTRTRLRIADSVPATKCHVASDQKPPWDSTRFHRLRHTNLHTHPNAARSESSPNPSSSLLAELEILVRGDARLPAGFGSVGA